MSFKEIGKSVKIDSDLIFKTFPKQALEACEILHKTIKAFVAGNEEKVRKYANDVIKCEAEIDELKDHIMMSLATVRSLPYMAIDQYSLINYIDEVADRAEIAARLMRTHMPPVPVELQNKFLQLSEHMIETTELLAESIEELLDDYDEAWEKARACEKARTAAVHLHYEIIEDAYKEELRGRDVNFIVKLTRRIALIADKAEETADFVRLLVIKYRV